jgi:isopentenyldiphosphate isomerase
MGISDDPATIVQHMLYRIQQVNRLSIDNDNANKDDPILDLVIDNVVVGKMTYTKAQVLCQIQPNQSPVFCLVDNHNAPSRPIVTLSSTIASNCAARTAAVQQVMETLRDSNTTSLSHTWRNEMYPVAESFEAPPKLLIERACIPWLGALEYGVHINGMIASNNNNHPTTTTTTATQDDTKDYRTLPRLWMARRSATKPTYPNMVDHIVAGGQPAGISIWDNAIKECAEEAGISSEMAQQGLRPVGAVSYATRTTTNDQGITRAVMFIYDLYLPADFRPKVVDGEVQEFFTFSINDMIQCLHPHTTDPMKPNCYLVLIDWLLRHGHISPDTPGYLDVLRNLRNGDCQ